MLSMLREGGPTWRRAGRVDGEAGRNGACGASAKPCAVERRVSGVPPAPSTGGGDGLPDLPREGRGRGVLSRSDAPAERSREDGASADLGGEAWGIYGAGRRGGQLG